MFPDISPPLRPVRTALEARGTTVELGVGTFGTVIELMTPNGYFEHTFPTPAPSIFVWP
jgi:hypothetical protein